MIAKPIIDLTDSNNLTTLHSMDVELFALKVGWTGMLLGVLSGAVIGLLFHRKDWLGGYAASARRMVRLGHISFFGIGLINLFYGLSIKPMQIPNEAGMVGAQMLLGALVTMPICCFLTAWKPHARHLFPIPVICATGGILTIIVKGGLV